MAGFAFAITCEPGHGLGSTPIKVMFESLVSGEGLGQRSGIGKLREFLVSPEAKLLTRGNDRALGELVLQAIYLQLHRKPVSKLALAEEGAIYFRQQQKDRVKKIAELFKLPKGS